MNKEKFFNIFEIEKMNSKSLTLVEKSTCEHFFISRKAFNLIMSGQVEQIRDNWIEFSDGKSARWIQVLVWQTF